MENNHMRKNLDEDSKALLIAAFNKRNYVSKEEAEELAIKINVPPKKIKIWFQNRRSKIKREEFKKSGQKHPLALPPSFTLSYSSIQKKENQEHEKDSNNVENFPLTSSNQSGSFPTSYCESLPLQETTNFSPHTVFNTTVTQDANFITSYWDSLHPYEDLPELNLQEISDILQD